jgi:uncharacterized membrane protein
MLDSSSNQVPTPTTQPVLAAAGGAAPEAELLKRLLEKEGVPGGVIQKVEMVVQRFHAGPLPTVETFEGYERVCPGAARDILNMAMQQQQHIHNMEGYAASAEFWLPVLALGVAGIIIAAMLAAGVYLAMNAHENLAIGVFSGTGIATVAGTFFQRWKSDPPVSPPAPPSPQKKQKKRR